nr:ATP-dependent helicase [uncultured Flavobacterium sp.]
MIFDINEEREAYLKASGKVILNACPGSGKTTTIARKIIKLQEDDILGSHSGVACLSFTNSAKDEINETYTKLSGKILSFPHHVSTIDSFINKFITLPFYNVLNRDFKRPKILDHTSILDNMWKTTYKDKEGNLKDGLQYSINQFKAKNNRSIFHLYPPSKIRIETDGTFTVEGNKPSIQNVDLNTFNDYCKHVKGAQFSKGLISTGDSAYIALHILKTKPQIGKWLSLRFPYIIIDEAQDNSLIQHAIFEKLVEFGLNNLDLIGDPYQSLYEWRDANPNEFLKKYHNDESWKSFDLTDNRRSPQRIIDCFSLLRKPDDVQIKSKCSTDLGHRIIIYKYNEKNHLQIIQNYEGFCLINNFTLNNIVVRGNSLKNKLLGHSEEQRPWGSDIPKSIISAKNKYIGNDIKQAINELRIVVIKLINPKKDYHTLKEIERDLKTEHKFNSLLMEILSGMPDFSLTISEWTIKTQTFLKEKLNLEFDLDFELRNRKSKFLDKKTLDESVTSHFNKSYSNSNIPITTIHQVKGRSLDTILVFFNDKKHNDNIVFEDIENPNNLFPSEKKRLIYVALSRPKHALAMAFPEKISNKKLKEKFGDDIVIIDNA